MELLNIVMIFLIFLGNAGITLKSSTDFTAILIIANICFPAGTTVNTEQGKIAIEKLIPGENTINNKKIVTVTKTNILIVLYLLY